MRSQPDQFCDVLAASNVGFFTCFAYVMENHDPTQRMS